MARAKEPGHHAPVGQLAESMDLKSIKSWFESRSGYMLEYGPVV